MKLKRLSILLSGKPSNYCSPRTRTGVVKSVEGDDECSVLVTEYEPVHVPESPSPAVDDL